MTMVPWHGTPVALEERSNLNLNQTNQQKILRCSLRLFPPPSLRPPPFLPTHDPLDQPLIGRLQLRLLPAPLLRQPLRRVPRLVPRLERHPVLPRARLPEPGNLFQGFLQPVAGLLRLTVTAGGGLFRFRAPALDGLLVGLEGGNLCFRGVVVRDGRLLVRGCRLKFGCERSGIAS